MGFMDFLKKESKDLKFKENNQSKDSFDTIPPPPKEASAAGQNNQQSSTSGQEKQAPALPGAEQNTPNQGMPAFPESKPDAQPQSAESLFPQSTPDSQSNQTQDHSEFMPPSDFDEQPEFPEKESLDNIGWDQDPAYTSAEPKEVLDNQTGNNPFERADNQDDEDLSLPDLPDIPSSAMSDSLGASVDKQETAEKSDEQKSFDDVNNAQNNMNEQGSTKTQEKPELPEHKPEEAPSEQPDDLPELDAEYLPEDEAIEEEEKEHFIESYQFYETLQDIKAIKRGFKDADKVMKDWGELDGSIEEEAEKFMETIDTLQEEMIKIDSTLFEEG